VEVQNVKRLIIIGVLLFALVIATSTPGSAYTSSERNLVEVTDGYLYYTVHIAGATSYDNNITLPVAIGDLNHTQTKITWHWTGAVRMLDGYWNQRGYPDYNYTTGSVSEALWVAETNGLDYASTYSHINFSMNNTNWYADVYYIYDDIAGINSAITITEEDINDPNLDGFWTVNDTLTFTAPPLPTGVVAYLKVEFPPCVGAKYAWPWNGTTVANGTELCVNYQKYGPANDEDNIDVDDTAAGVTVTLASDDEISDVDWEIDLSNPLWDGAFDGIDEDTLEVELNGHTVDDWHMSDLVLEGINIDEGDNEFVFTWTEAETGGTGGTTPAPTAPYGGPGINWDAEVAEGVPTWAAVAIGIVVLFTIIAVVSIEKK
jgi:hypothetical protein